MRFSLQHILILSCALLLPTTLLHAEDDAAVRQKLARAILSEGGEQQKLLGELADTGKKLLREPLIAWTRDGVFLYETTNAAKVPVILEDQLDADGKARAIRIDDGQFLKDAANHELRGQ